MEGVEFAKQVSILIPIRNEQAYIERCLRAVMNQDYPPENVEILIIDGMSKDHTRAVIRDVCNEYPSRQVKILDNPRNIVSTGLNIGLVEASGDYIVRVDGHCEIASDYLTSSIRYLEAGLADCVGGRIETIGETPLARVIAQGMSSKFGVGDSAFRVGGSGDQNVDTVAFPAFTRDAIRKTGLFDEELVRNQDDEYSYRLRKWGGRILLSSQVRSRYYSRSSLAGLWRQYFQYGYWKVRVLQKHPRQMRPRQFVPPLLVLGLIVSGILLIALSFTRVPPLLQFLALLFPAIYVFANITVSLLTILRSSTPVSGNKILLALPLVFACLHLGYGLGFLAGLIAFWDRWRDQVGQTPKISLDLN